MFFLLIVVFRYIQIWFRFRTEISTGIIRHKAYFARANRSDEQNQIHFLHNNSISDKLADTYLLSLLYLSFHRDQRSK